MLLFCLYTCACMQLDGIWANCTHAVLKLLHVNTCMYAISCVYLVSRVATEQLHACSLQAFMLCFILSCTTTTSSCQYPIDFQKATNSFDAIFELPFEIDLIGSFILCTYACMQKAINCMCAVCKQNKQ